MAVSTTISKIQVRRGPQSDLPYALDAGEYGFTTDTGRVFIGIDPNASPTAPASLGRPNFPYQNIELLTEFSNSANQNMFDSRVRDVKTGFFTTAPLTPNDPNNQSDWSTVQVIVDGGSPTAFKTNISNNAGCAQISYFLFENGSAVRTGKLTIMTPNTSDSNPPLCVDEGVSLTRVDIGIANTSIATTPDFVFGSIQFRVIATINGYLLQVRNLGTSNIAMLFRIERASL